MKRIRKMRTLLAIPALLLSLAFVWAGCSGGGGGGGDLPGPISFTSAEQAGASSPTAMGVTALGMVTTGEAFDLANGSIPAYAPASKKTADTAAIAKLDPRLKELVDRMKAQLQAPVLKKAVKKAQELAASRVVSINTTLSCDNYAGGTTGTVTVVGTDNSDTYLTDGFLETDITVTFNTCRDNFLLTELSGTLRLYEKSANDSSYFIGNMTATNFTQKIYSVDFSPANLVLTNVVNATFGNDETPSGGTGTGNGSFNTTWYDGEVDTLTFTNMSDIWTFSAVSGVETSEDTVNGSFRFAASIPGYGTYSLAITLTDLYHKLAYNTATSAADEWIDGTVSINWTPDPLGCIEGSMTFTTVTPMHYNNYIADMCPVSGELAVNNATIVFLPASIEVTINGITYYTDCTGIQGSICIGT